MSPDKPLGSCSSCGRPAPGGSRFCASCGGAVDSLSEAPTRLRGESHGLRSGSSAMRLSSSDSLEGVRFIPGTMVAGRYRIVGLIGKGGMGEVYRADDLKLGQAVALKFLSPSLGEDEPRLQRLLNEVRSARQISHSSVCRVYDIGEADGQHYLSMEYVDGEDLSTLLRRIGRLPGERGVQIARQLCAGLAAAHDQGILHRDLKPANVMLDGRGRVRITDFGLASLAEDVQGAEIRSGTPAYMAPEQLAGRGVSVQSDLYSLGLILYEMFTGQRAFDARSQAELIIMHQSTTPSSPSRHVKGLDPAVERVVLRCLEREPQDRPASALAVSAALPGGDPLAAALAAGETPSPQMVADAALAGGLSLRAAIISTVLILAGFAGLLLSADRVLLHNRVDLPRAPEVLRVQAQELLQSLGYTDTPGHSLQGFSLDTSYLQHLSRQQEDLPGDARWAAIGTIRPAPLSYWYRQSPRPMLPVAGVGFATESNPPATRSGMVTVRLDPRGRLVALQAVPPQREDEVPGEAVTDWAPLLAAAGLEGAELEPAAARWVSLTYCDERAAWTGTYPDQADVPLRLEACAYRGKASFFQVILPWTRASRQDPDDRSTLQGVFIVVFIFILLILLLTGIFLARRHIVRGQGDRRGAFRLAVFIFTARMIFWVLRVDHVAGPEEFALLAASLQSSLFVAAIIWLLYMALEPYVRRLWPDALVSWNRLLAGRFRDPAVGRDILYGGLAGVGVGMGNMLSQVAPGWLGMANPQPVAAQMDTLLGLRQALGMFFANQLGSMLSVLGVLFFIVLLRVLLRRQILAIGAAVLILNISGLANQPSVVEMVANLILWSLVVFVMVRFGVLAAMVMFLFINVAFLYPFTAHLSRWYAGQGLFVLGVLLALTAYGFHVSLAGRRLIREDFLSS